MLLIFETHPVPYHAQVYRALSRDFRVPLAVLYGSDFSVAGYHDREFASNISWDCDLLSGYESHFLSRTSKGGARTYEDVSGKGLAHIADNIRPSVAMVLGYFHRLDRHALHYSWARGIPVMFRGETSDDAHRRSPLRSLARDTVLRTIYKRCAKLLYVGKPARDHYIRLGCGESALRFSPYCVDESNFASDESFRVESRSSVRGELGIAEDTVVLIFSGKLTARKGVDLLFNALMKLTSALREKIEVLFVGDGIMRSELEAQFSVPRGIRAHFVGFQNQTRLSKFYHASDVLILPSRIAETWGVVVNEALLHGLACVTSDAVGSHQDLVLPGVSGEVHTADEVHSLSEAITRVCEIGFGLNARERRRGIAARFSTQVAARGIAGAYHEVVAEREVVK
jgi:glycosyltransferase involved in cell wall biosynthesis